MHQENRVAVVTGAGGQRGIGRAIAIRFARLGLDVALIDVPSSGAAEAQKPSAWRGIESVREEIATLGRRSVAIHADITQPDKVVGAFDQVLRDLGKMDVLVNNARAIIGKDLAPVAELEVAEWDRIMSVNARGALLCAQALARHLIQRNSGGHIVNVSSVASRRANGNLAAYSASKSAMNSLTQSLAVELGRYDIRANAVCPGMVDTGRFSLAEAQEAERTGIPTEELARRRFEAHMQRQALHRVGTAEDVAGVAAFLISADAAHVTGQCINVCGGEFFN